MSAAKLKSLLAPPSVELSIERATASLDAHFTSIDDLDQLEHLAAEAEAKREDLNAQTASSEQDLQEFLSQTRKVAQSLLDNAKELSLERHILADELSELNSQLISVMSDGESQPTLLEDLQTLHRSLKELESVRSYVQVIRHALKLREAALDQLRTVQNISVKSLDQYSKLLNFVANVTQSLGSVEDAGGMQKLHLATFLDDIREKTWKDMKAQLSGTLLELAEKLGWPMPVEYANCDRETRREFERAFVKLIHLRQVKDKIVEGHNLDKPEEGGLYPIEALVQPVALRFKYHFEGTRQTNRLDKPEWYFTHIVNIAHEHKHFFETAIQHLLSASNLKNISAWREFAMLLLPILTKKLKKTIPQLIPRPSLFAHTIHQALIFDAAYKEEGFGLETTSAHPDPDTDVTWEGVGDVILGNPEWFSAWVHAEKDFTDAQYNDIIGAADAWTISDETEDENSTWDIRPTNSARRIRSLFDQITDRFSPLPSPIHRARFLISIQLPLLELYRGRISSSLDAFETISHALLRAVPGALSLSLSGASRDTGSVNIESQHLANGVAGVQRLCKALISASVTRSALEAWSEETFFLELWQDILNNPTVRSYAEQSLLVPELGSQGQDANQTAFDETIYKYKELIQRAEDMIVQQICGEVEAGLRAHFVAAASQQTTEPQDNIGISQTLLGPLALLSSDLSFLRSALPQHIFTSLYRRIASNLAEHILQRQILYRGQFSKHEGTTLHAECELWVETCQTAVGGSLGGGRQRVEAPWAKLLQAGRLVGADREAWDTIVTATFGTVNETEWEQVMLDVTGVSEMSREDVSKLLRRREA